MKNNFFDKFKPKENRFFPLLSEMAQVLLSASGLIIKCVQVKTHDGAVDYYKKIKELEHKSDAIQNRIFLELNKTFITPFDREDINHLSSTMDNVMDLINSCAKRIMLYNPKKMPESAVRLAEYVHESAGYVVQAIDELDVLKKRGIRIKKYCEQLGTVEKKADDVYEHFLIDLFEAETDAIEVIKLKDILQELERATDAADSVGKIIKIIIVKYS